jgi:hypothetical protein
MVALQTATVTGSAATSIVLGSGNTIPQGYTDLFLVINGQGSAVSGGNLCVRINADTNTYTSATRILGDGSAASSSRNTTGQSSGIMMGDVSNGDKFMAEINFQNYSNTTTFKTLLGRYSGQTYLGGYAGLWAQTAAITQITLLINGGQQFNVGTTVTLYGIKAASVGAYATGGVIYQDATYFYHAFPSTGTFTPSQNLSADILVVAGGGGGGLSFGSGAGGGGLKTFTSQSLTSGTGYTCTVGGGGASTASTASQGSPGGNSSFGSLTPVSVGGAGGTGTASGAAASGGSGAGGSGGSGNKTAGLGTSGQGNNGGTGNTSASGGGGGAGSAGTSPSGTLGGAGGYGLSTAISGGSATGLGILYNGSYYFAGGGTGNGTGGSDPVAYGSVAQGANAPLYSGAGGGGDGGSSGSGAGGIIIVRYAK